MIEALKYKDINYSLKKSDRKTISIFIERDGSVNILAPAPYQLEKIEEVIEAKRSWIYRNLAEWEDLNRTQLQREFVNGEGFIYLGRSYRLSLEENQETDLLLKRGRFLLRRDKIHRGTEIFKAFYKQKGLKKIKERIALYAPKIGVKVNNIKVQELQNRWGSCSAEGNLNFHWKCLMAPVSVLDYIVVHELTHLQHRNHDSHFWNTVDKVMPDYHKHMKWLKHNGADMSL
ncbi:M48 family metallopeptidase [Pseudoalteromonas fuliginea]|uniref:M48 family metallopeptidase n=1 Tax=Pseudoalteromonas fuliginea TaxID=1872678 RepID=UPI00051924A8|nr:SprT family zinc-dependent metalloprotease [Pseudoalteromonas fuliginea]KJZ29128.1 metal-dependent hydrolase [Pseudoalteromonas fuliginea]